MSFLDKMKAKEGTESKTITKKKPLPFLKPKVKEEETKDDVKEDRIEPFGPVDESVIEKKAEEVKTEEPKKEVKKDPKKEVKEDKPKEEIKVETKKEEKTEDEPKEEDKKSDDKKESKAEDKSDDRSDSKSDKEDKPKAKKRTRNTKASKTDKKSDEPLVLPTTEIDYATAIQNIAPPFVDGEWEEFRIEIDQELGQIEIEDDMNPGALKVIIADLSKLRQKLWLPLQDTKSLFESLSSREPEGLIERVKRVAFDSEHKNDAERRKSGVIACMSYVPPNSDDPINLYEMLHETRARYNFLRAAMESVQYKTNILITMNGALKLEQSHTPGEV